ncbi:alpha/beta hydrolase family protein [Zhongshania sp. BJYM1]|uniref:alpha/beta hydrolase family protein n=1 Tax=Zhongshania aquatica TaxID=2965069 RepID=UPI0022B34B94|nr:alpha/beta fold hydrolase [Marortus sp. BJYM1]
MIQNTFIFALSLVFLLSQPLFADEAAPSTVVDSLQPPALSLYGHLPSLDMVALSSSGRQQAMLATIQDRRLLVVGDVGKEIAIKVDMGDIKARDLYWVGERYVVVITSSTQNLGMFYGYKYELLNLVILDTKSKDLYWPMSKSTKVLNAAFGIHPPVMSDEGWLQCIDTLPLSRNAFSRESWISGFELEVSCINLDKRRLTVIAKGRKDGSGWLVGAGPTILARETQDNIRTDWELYAGNHGDRLFKSKDPFGRNGIVGQGRTEGTVLFVSHDRDGAGYLLEMPLDGSSEPVELYPEVNVDRYVFNKITGLFSGVVISGDNPRLEMIDDKLEARVRGTRKAFPGLNVNFEAASDDLSRIVVRTDGAGDTGTWWLVDIAKGSAVEIGWRYPGFKASQIGPVTSFHYAAADGLDIPAVLTLPPHREAKNLPVVILPHRGPESRDYPEFNWLAQAFASRGYAVLQPNFRGSSGYGVGFRNAGFGEWGRKMQTDLSDGVAALAKQGTIDPNRACIVGASYGGYAALAGVTVQQGVYRCAVAIAPVSDLNLFLRDKQFEKKRNSLRYWKEFMGADSTSDDRLDAISPYTLAERADAPIMLIHGDDDTIVEIVHSERMAKKLHAAKKPYEFIEISGADHFMSKEVTRQRILAESVRFVIKHNPPELEAIRDWSGEE